MRNDHHVVSRKNYIKSVISEKSSLRLLCSESVVAETNEITRKDLWLFCGWHRRFYSNSWYPGNPWLVVFRSAVSCRQWLRL